MSILTTERTAKPFLKWAGGKTQLISEIEKRLPVKIENGKIDTYIEPFVGGGAVFFYIAQNYENIIKFYLFDINQDLVECYNAIKNDVEKLIRQLKNLEKEFLCVTNRRKYFLKKRTLFNKNRSPAKLIFLNKTCFNGLYRVNRKGEFNVPFGDYKNPRICDEENLRAVSEILQKAEIVCGDFTESKEYANSNSFVYLDPPYRPISQTASFTSYTQNSFSEEDQVKLAEFCQELNKKKVKLFLSNSDPPNEDSGDNFFEKHYPPKSGFTIEKVQASRVINCKGTKRGQINELIITNY